MKTNGHDASGPSHLIQTWAQRYRASFDRHRIAHHEPVAPDLEATLPKAMEWGLFNNIFPDFSPEEHDLIAEAVRARTLIGAREFADDIVGVARYCESPIEVAMAGALAVAGQMMFRDVVYRHGHREWGGRPDSAYVLRIEPQVAIGDYRVDFLLTGETRRYFVDDRGRIDIERGVAAVDERKMVLECDGHDFHDRTPEQASRDRARDRFLQSRGYKTYRYTGRDIWRDAFAAATEAVRELLPSDDE